MPKLRTVVAATALAWLAPEMLAAQQMTAYKTGEQTTGMTKQCIYDALGSTYTTTIKAVELCPLSIKVERRTAAPPAPTTPATPPPSTITARLTGEKTTGMTKQCFYEYLGSEYTRTISSVALCPLSAQFSRR